ncbi:MAG: glycosyltransferase [Alphaproteobacteria bacterium]
MSKILFVIGSLSTGGAERHLCLVLPYLRAKGFDVSVFCLTQKGELSHQLEEVGIKVYAPVLGKTKGKVRRFLKLFKVFFSLKSYIKKHNPDIVHMFLPEAYILGGFCCFFYPKIKFVMSRRSLNNYQKKYPFITRIESFLHKRMAAVSGNSKAVVKQLEEEGAPIDKLNLIYNGVDLDKYDLKQTKSEIRKKIGIDDDCLVLTMIANLFPYKGHADLFQALSLIKDEMPEDWKLLLVGRDEGTEVSLKKYAKENDFLNHIYFMGMREDIPQILKASDIGLSCSHEEGFSNSILEMMASSLALAVTNAGGNAESVEDGTSGFIVPAKEPSKMAEAILKLKDSDLRQKMGKAARERAVKQFSLPKCIDTYEEFYKKVL